MSSTVFFIYLSHKKVLLTASATTTPRRTEFIALLILNAFINLQHFFFIFFTNSIPFFCCSKDSSFLLPFLFVFFAFCLVSFFLTLFYIYFFFFSFLFCLQRKRCRGCSASSTQSLCFLVFKYRSTKTRGVVDEVGESAARRKRKYRSYRMH